uniref:PHD-type domain-containing protein n=1 Tax=Pristionchus pacificus TaxID=54126 RepID=A0A8R1Z630_PRIPA
MATSKEDKDEDIIFEGVKKIKTGSLSIAAKRKEKRPKVNGIALVNRPIVHDSSEDEEDDEDEDEEDEDEELDFNRPIRMPKYKKKETQKTQREIEKEEFFTKFQLQRRDDPRALLTHETLCNLSEAVGTLNEERDPDHPTTSVNGVVMPDPFHALQAMDHNLWVLASAASLRLNEVTGRCLLLPNGDEERERGDDSDEVDEKKEKRAGEDVNRKEKPSALMEMLPKALAALSGQQIGFKEKEPEKPKGKGRAPAAAATKPVTRERPVREKPEPKKKPPPQPKVAAKTKTAQTRSNTALNEKVEAAVVESKNGKGPKTRATKEEEAPPPATANTRKRKAAKDKEEEEEDKTPAKKGGNTVKRTSQRTVKKAKEDEPTYCHCNRISFGEMVGCDNETCAIEWFHFECINIKSKPKGKWYCPDCRAEPNNSKQPKKPSK